MTQQEWMEFVTEKIQNYKHKYVISWWLRLDTGFPTQKINYELNKLVKKGLLIRESNHYGVKYSLPPVTGTTPSSESNGLSNSEK